MTDIFGSLPTPQVTISTDTILTRDNLPLSSPTTDPQTIPRGGAINCKTELAYNVAAYVRDSLAGNTRRAYQSDLLHFESWGGCIPASETLVASYLAAHAETLSVATLVRRLASLSYAHTLRGVANPVRHELVRATLRGIKRRRGSAQREAKALIKEDLFAVLDAMGDSIKDVRDRAVLLLGFAGGFRRSELVAIDISAIEFVRHGAIVTVPRSKTDQVGASRKVGIPLGRTRHCPVAALTAWIARSGITEGALFRPVDRHGGINSARLSGEAVSLVIRERVKATGMEPTAYSGHSLRAGLATSAAQAGVPSRKIRQQTGHASDAMLSRYVRDAEMFVGNATGALL